MPETEPETEPPNEHVYIHEIVDIIGHNRERYTHHMTANWSPGAQQRREQLCFGVWNVLGSTGGWPKVLNIWEEQGWKGLSESFAAETVGAGAQDPDLATWWSAASEFRSGGSDRILLPATWSPSVGELMMRPPQAACYAHETLSLRPGEAQSLLQAVRKTAIPAYAEFGASLVCANRTALRLDDEVIVMWAFPTWSAWSEFESAWSSPEHTALAEWRRFLNAEVHGCERFLATDSALNPTKLGRQPRIGDQRPFA